MDSTPCPDRVYRSRRFKSLGGVCAGVALARGYSLSLTRIVTLLISIVSGIGVIAYLAAWVLLPGYEQSPVPEPLELPHDPLRRSLTDRRIAGVCGGLAKLWGVDSNLLRVVLVLLVCCGGLGLLPYFYAWAVVPVERAPDGIRV